MNKEAARAELDDGSLTLKSWQKSWLMGWAQRHFGQSKVARYRMDNIEALENALSALANAGHKVWVESEEEHVPYKYYLCIEAREGGDE